MLSSAMYIRAARVGEKGGQAGASSPRPDFLNDLLYMGI